jgi:GTP cyclohydrolase I
MINGSSPLVAQENRDARERENAFKSIKSSMGPKKEPVDLDANYFQPQTSAQPRDKRPSKLANLEEAEARDPRDDPYHRLRRSELAQYALADSDCHLLI